MALLLDAMPALWAPTIYGPSTQPTHLASAHPADLRVFCPAADGQLTHAYTAYSTAALLPLGQPAQPMEAQDLPADPRPVLVIDPHQAMASQPLSHPAPGTSSGPPPCWGLVRWHCGSRS